MAQELDWKQNAWVVGGAIGGGLLILEYFVIQPIKAAIAKRRERAEAASQSRSEEAQTEIRALTETALLRATPNEARQKKLAWINDGMATVGFLWTTVILVGFIHDYGYVERRYVLASVLAVFAAVLVVLWYVVRVSPIVKDGKQLVGFAAWLSLWGIFWGVVFVLAKWVVPDI